jgi:hypothetical protein
MSSKRLQYITVTEKFKGQITGLYFKWAIFAGAGDKWCADITRVFGAETQVSRLRSQDSRYRGKEAAFLTCLM